MQINIKTNFKDIFDNFLKQKEFVDLLDKVDQLYSLNEVFPPKNLIFDCFNYFNIEDTKVVIIGQDPYHGINQANGLAFSVNDNVKLPKSLINIFKELKNDLGIIKTNGNLSSWAKQGVLLLNSTLTVNKNQAGSHQFLNWEKYTDEIIKIINRTKKHVVYILWGNWAINKKRFIDDKNNLIICSSHPSPLSAYHSFFNSKPFSRTNNYLSKNSIAKIIW